MFEGPAYPPAAAADGLLYELYEWRGLKVLAGGDGAERIAEGLDGGCHAPDVETIDFADGNLREAAYCSCPAVTDDEDEGPAEGKKLGVICTPFGYAEACSAW